jgi:acetyl esterase/lipase
MFKLPGTLLAAWSLFAASITFAAQLETTPLNDADFVTPPVASMPGILWFWHSTPMTPEIIKKQLAEMHEAGFGGVMMFPLGSNPKYYTEEFYELFEVVLREAEKLGLSIWLTNDQHIPTGHGAQKVVPGGKIHDGLTLEPRPDLRAEKLLHVNMPVTGGRTVSLTDTFPGYHDIPPTINFYKGEMTGRSTEAMIGNQGGNWMDYKYQVDITPLPWSGNPLVPGNYIETGWIFRADKATGSGYAWILSDRTSLGQGVAALKKVIFKDGKPKRELPPVKLPFEKFEEKPYQIKTVMLNNRIETFIDGVSVDVTEDATYRVGTVGFYLPHPCRGRYDNINVLSMSDDVIYEDNCDSNGKWRFWGPSASVDEVFSVAAVPLVDGKPQAEGILDLTDVFAAKPAHWYAPAGEWSIDYFMKRKDTKMPFNYPDLYHPDTIKRHLQITYGEIVRRYPWAIGTTFKGFWSDEPHSTASTGKAWSAQFEKDLLAGGHEIGTTLAAVYNDFGRESRRLRAPYYQQVIEGWAETFARLQGEWCKAQGLDFMTNPVIDSAPPYGAFNGGNGLQMNQWSNVPGVDAIYGQIMPGKRSLISRWATSSANQQGNQHVLYEVYGGYGWDVTPNIVRYVNGNLMVRGANRASYHAFWTNPDAVGYAPPFDPSSTWWSEQDELNLWNGRLQEMNLGKALSNVGLMNPTSTLYADEMNLDGRLMNPAFTETYYLLEDHQVSFDLVDETSLNDNPVMRTQAVPVHGGLQLGHQRYNLIIVPRAHTLSLKALQTLDEMVELGGVVIATHLIPEEELEGRDEELQALIKKVFGENPSATPHRYGRGWTAFAKEQDSIPALLKQVAGPFGQSRMRTVRFEQEYPNVRVLKRERANAIVYLLMNEGEDAIEPTVSFYEDEQVPEIWDPETGSQLTAPVYSTHGDWGVHMPLKLNAYQTKVVVFKKDAPYPSEVPHLIARPESVDVLSVEATGERAFNATVLAGNEEALELVGSFNGWRYTANLEAANLPGVGRLDDGWELRFEDEPNKTQPVQLGSWTSLRPDYSGTASYAMRFKLPAEALNAQRQWHIDLGTVKDVARIEINGQMLEPMLWPPYTQDLTPYLKAGENHLKVSVSNTLANKHGQVIDSGLLGPVTLTPKHYRKVEFKPVAGAAYEPVVLPMEAASPGQPLIGEFVYRKVGDAELKMKVWYPPTWKPGGPKLPTTVFIFGGGWYMGGTSQFNMLGPYLSNRGMIVLAPEYRTHLDGMPPNICLEDAKSAMRYIYKHADELSIDADRVAAGGISAGGHLAAATAFCDGFNSPGDDLSLPVKPKALVLFVPVIDNGPGGFRHVHVKNYWEGFSPLHNIREGAPPTIFITGDQDEYSPIETVRRYKAEMDKVGGRCELIVLEGGTHAAPLSAEFQQRSLAEMDSFLVSIGYLPAQNQTE